MTPLHQRAAAAGLQRHWQDANGRPQRVADDVLDAILARLDTSPADTRFVSADVGAPIALPGISGPAELVLEDGRTTRVAIADGRLTGIGTIGYHRLVTRERSFVLAVAPARCPAPTGRSWGVAVQIPALRDGTASGFGDFGSLAAAAASLGSAGANAVAISPTHALFPADPTRFSPYAPSSRLFHNVLLTDPTLVGASTLAEPSDALIDWPSSARARLHHLRGAFERLDGEARAALARFRVEGGAALECHARFDALHATLGGSGWRDWPTAFHDPNGAAVAQFAAEHANEVAFYACLQWLTTDSLAAAQRAARASMSIGLVADLAVGVDAGGSQAWSDSGDLLQGLTIGAPPDPLGPEGQNWGITAFDPFALARRAFQPFVHTIRTALAHAGGVRIDHALGLERLWVVPEGAGAGDGAYLAMPGDHLKRIIAIEAHRAGAVVIAEDLGTVPPGFRDDLARRGMLGMRVIPFERDKQGDFTPPGSWDSDAVALTGTHDTPTLAGWWTGHDLAWNRRLGRSVPADANAQRAEERKSLWLALDQVGAPPKAPPVDMVLASVAEAPCPVLIVPMEDLLGAEEQPNIPGTVDEHPNWRRRLPAPMPDLLARPEVTGRAAMLTAKRPG